MIERRRGTIQYQRENKNLIAQRFRIDDRSFEDLLGYMVSFLEHVNFYNTDNEIDGNWKVLLEHDPVIYIVTIINEPVYLDESEDDTQMVQDLLHWYTKIEKWYRDLRELEEDILADKIGNISADIITTQKDRLTNYVNQQNKNKQKPKSFSEAVKVYSGAEKKQEQKQDVDVSEMVHTLKKVVLHIQDFAKKYLQKYLFTKDDHMPNNALYIAFALLYKRLKDKINTLSKKHLDFYYRDVLQQTTSPGVATQAVICFEVLSKFGSVPIPEKTQFSAGKIFGSKTSILFETSKAVMVCAVKLESIRTLYFNQSPFIKIGTKLPTITNIIKNELVTKGKSNDAEEINWSLFGADEDTLINSEIEPTSITDIGYMIGSQVLYLEEGKRRVSISFRMETNSAQDIFWKLLDEVKESQAVPMDVVFNMIFEEAFTISYTSTKKWESVPVYDVFYNREENVFGIGFILHNTDPAVTSLATEKSNSVWPMVKVVFDEYAPFYTYSFFKGIQLESIDIDVEVSGVKNLSLYNNIGKMPLTKSFDLFGPSPRKGGYLMIGKSELFKKELTDLTIDIEWDNVPYEYGGFDAYYMAYAEPFSNDSFKVELSALSNGYWFPQDSDLAQEVNLYTTESCYTPEGYESVRVSENRTLKLDHLEAFKLSRDYRLHDPIKYDVHTKGGFFKLTLIAPEYAFGKNLYQKNYTEVAVSNAKNDEDLPLPNKPFVPKVKSVAISYTAKDSMYFNNTLSNENNPDIVAGDYLHITPFGIKKTLKDSKVYENTIVPDFEGQGYLYLSLSSPQPLMEVTLYFDVLNKTPSNVNSYEGIIFQYKELSDWVTLTEKHIISDSTNRLTKSGIIEFSFPSRFQPNDAGLYELRCVAKHKAYLYPMLKGIYPNAVVATCTSDDDSIIGKKVPANSISKTVTKMPALKKITQPAPSYGGKLAGTEATFYTDVSERLRHKDRAISIWDYERMMLQYFHDVIIAKCTNLTQNFKPKAGNVTIVVLARRWRTEEHFYFNTDELAAMASYINQKSNPFIKIKVRNPIVEWLLVNCKVTFYAEDNGGYYINQLNQEISDYLSPLPSDKNSNIEGIGAVVEPRMLMSYIENLEYIKVVHEINIEHIVKKGINDFTMKVYHASEQIKPTTPWSILAPVNKHNINRETEVDEAPLDTPSGEDETDLLNMQVGVDFIISDDSTEESEEPVTTVKQEEAITKIKKEVKETKQEYKVVPVNKGNTDVVLTFKINTDSDKKK